MILKNSRRAKTILIVLAFCFFSLGLLIFQNVRPALAASCVFGTATNVTATSTCTVTGVDGVDGGSSSVLNVPSNVTITLNSGATLVANQIHPSASSVITVTPGSQILTNAVLCFSDGSNVLAGNADNYAAVTTPGQTLPAYIAQTGTVCPLHYVRKNNLNSINVLECKKDSSSNCYYSNSGTCTICPAGSYCPFAPAAANVLLTNAANIGLANAAISCPNGTTSSAGACSCTALTCSAGYYASGNNCVIDPPGTYSAYGINVYSNCAAGYYCPSGNTTSQGSIVGNPNGTAGGACSCGYWCGGANTSATGAYATGGLGGSCQAGYYCSGTNTSATGNGQCSAGYYCSANSCSATQHPLTCGYWGALGASSATGSGACSAGYWCGSLNTSATGAFATGGSGGQCTAGNYCPGTANCAQTTCTCGHICTANGLSAPDVTCAADHYNQNSGSSSGTATTPACTQCSSGYTTNGVLGMCSCNTGVTCTAGFYVNGNACSSCTAGTYSLGGTVTACSNCAAGHYCTGADPTANGDGICAAGYWCGGANISATGAFAGGGSGGTCSAGYYCPGGNTTNLGSIVGNPSGGTAGGQCTCGYWCGGTNTTAIGGYAGSGSGGNCQAGYWCPVGSTSALGAPSGNICAAGYYCPINSCAQTQCTAGNYCPGTGNSAQTTCTCGHICTANGLTTAPDVTCAADHYNQNSGSSSGTSVTPACTQCSSGSSTSGLTGQCICSTLNCAAGYYVSGNACVGCTAGTYSLGGTVTACSNCAAGHYCTGADPTANGDGICAAGYWCGGANTSATGTFAGGGSGGTCSCGYWCGGANIDAIGDFATGGSGGNCSAGYYCTGTNTSATGNGQCSAGYWCGANSCSATQHLLTCGYWGSAGQTSATGSGACSAGYWCGSLNTSAIGGYATGGSGGPCNPGSWCGTASCLATQNQISCGYIGGWAATSATGSGTCTAGYYSAAGSSACSICPPGSYCASAGSCPVNITSCACGHYCSGGNTTANGDGTCNGGYWCGGANTNATGAYATGGTGGNCGSGNYCPAGSGCAAPPQPTCPCGHYCTTNTLSTPDGTCAADWYNPSTGSWSSSACVQCDSGKTTSGVTGQCFCTTGVTCSAGYYVNNHACSICSPGTYSLGGTGTACSNCAAGYYCPLGNTSAQGSVVGNPYGTAGGQCSCGYWCGGANTDATGDFATGGLGGACTAGYYCPAGSTTATGSPNGGQCLAGAYCQAVSCNPTNCPCGTFNTTTGGTGGGACTASANGGNCNYGYYCPGGNTNGQGSVVGNPYGTAGGQCSAGYSCTGSSCTNQGSGQCPAGTYSVAGGQCNSCAAGYYCPGGNTTAQGSIVGNPSGTAGGQCQAGNYCPAGSTTATGSPNGGQCLPGTYCPTGSSSPTNCPCGTFNTTTGGTGGGACTASANGGNCNSGYYCPGGNTNGQGSVVGNPYGTAGGQCSAGYSCTGSSCTNQGSGQCPAGTYSVAGGQCNSCAAGYYCPGGNTTAQGSIVGNPSGTAGGQCQAGYYCPAGSTTATGSPNGGPCTCGYWCGGTNTTAIGGYAGSGSGGNCQAGYWCPASSTSALGAPSGNICAAGYYCPANSCSQQACLQGTYNPNPGQTSSAACLTCPKDSWCGAGAPNYTACSAGTCTNGATGGTSQSSCNTTRSTCATYPSDCGTPPDGCGGTLGLCGTCSNPDTCGGGGKAFKCGHTCTYGYMDADKDNWGATGSYGCYAASGSYNIVVNSGDCNDNNAAITPYTYAITQNSGCDWAAGGSLDPQTRCTCDTGDTTQDCGASNWTNSVNGHGRCADYWWDGNPNHGTSGNCYTVTGLYCGSGGPCTYGAKDYDKDGYGAYGTFGCWVPSSSYNIVSNDSDCLDNDPTHTTSVSYGESSGYRTCFFAPLSSNGRTFGYCTNGVWGQSSTCYPNSESCSARCLPESTCASYTAAQCGYGNDNFGEQVGSFSSPCGPSTATQSCTVGTGNCARTGSQTRTCSTGDSWGVWGSWSACSVSAGAPGTCSSLGDNCGSDDSDGCGGTLNCGPDSRTSSCSVGTGNCARSGTQTQYCSGGTWGGAWTACNAVAGSPGTCSSMGGYVCGSSDSDGCGGTINCGANSNSQGCSVGTGSCARSGTQTQYCSGGFWGGWGSCSVSPGAPGTCSSLGYACGSSMSDGCGGNLNCGADSQSQGCSAGSGNCLHSGGTQTKSCNSGTWASNWSSCSVSAYSNATCAYMGYVCGSSLPDGCGGTLYICGNSTESQGCTVGTGSCQRTGTQSASCNGSGQWGSWGSCSVSPGSPGTCSSLGYACGSSMGDGCGGSLNCGANSRTSRTCYCSNYSANGYYSDTCVGGQWSNGSTCLPSGHPKCN